MEGDVVAMELPSLPLHPLQPLSHLPLPYYGKVSEAQELCPEAEDFSCLPGGHVNSVTPVRNLPQASEHHPASPSSNTVTWTLSSWAAGYQ